MHSAERYTAIAIVLHWAIAVAIVANMLIGWWMHEAVEARETQARAIAAFQLHKSIGLTILILSLVRLAWRLLHPPPALPEGMPALERFAAKATHWAFYALMIFIPLSGWLYVSSQWRGNHPLNVPTLWFGLFEVPHLLGLDAASHEVRRQFANLAFEAHELLVWSAVLLLGVHVAAALKHHFLNRDEVLAHMVPLIKAPNEVSPPLRDRRRTAVLLAGIAGIAIAMTSIAVALVQVPLRQPTSAATPAAEPAAEETPVPATAAVSETAPPDVVEAPPAGAPVIWIVDPARSEIAFSGEHAGVAFRGRFTRWSADIHFDPANLAQSRVEASIETASATDGVPLHDETLPQREWFDVSRHPQARFRSTALRARTGNGYELDGTLNIKARDLKLAPLTLSASGDRLTISGKLKIDRGDADLGMESDPAAEYVSRDITVDVRVEAARAP